MPNSNSQVTLKVPETSTPIALIVIAHADDLAFFCSGAVFMLSDAGWEIDVVRVTDDRWDSAGLSEQETITKNKFDLSRALDVIGIRNLFEFGYPTDSLGSCDEVLLRNKLVEVIRTSRPYLILTFDPDSLGNEDNLDHKVTALAANEACWTSGFDKHPIGEVDRKSPHLPIERWFFGRSVLSVTHRLPLEEYRERIFELISCHETMVANMLYQLELKAKFLGFSITRFRREVESNPKFFPNYLFKDRKWEEYRIVKSPLLDRVLQEFGDTDGS